MLRLLQMHTSQPVTPPRQHNPSLSPELEAVLLRALAKERAERYQSVHELVQDLLDALPDGADALLRSPVHTPPPGTKMPTPRPVPSASSGTVVSSSSQNVKLGAAAQHAMLEGGPTLMARPTGKSGKIATIPMPDEPGSPPPPVAATAAQSLPSVPASSTATIPRQSRRWPLVAAALVIAAAAAFLVLRPGPGKPPPVASSAPAPQPAAAGPSTPEPLPAPSTVPKPVEPSPAHDPAPAARTQVRLRVSSTPSGAEVRLDGKRLGVTPLDTRVDAESGTASLELRHGTRKRATRSVPLDQDLDLTVELVESKRGTRPTRPNPTSPTNPPDDLEIRGRR
jgi:serine/threonine-protein kinase